MKKLLAVLAAISLAGSVYAGCGTKIPVDGKLSAYDAEKKVLTVGDAEVTLDAGAKITDADGKEAKLEDLVGKEVNVSTDKHTKKAESVTVAKAK